MTRERTSLGSVQRAFEVMDLVGELDGVGPTELAERMELPNSTVYDYLKSLSNTKYVTKRGGEYYLSSYILTTAGKMRYRNQLFQVAKPEMRRVATETDELVGLTIEDQGMAVILHQEEGNHALSLGTYPGTRTPLHTVATGKAILAHLPEDTLDDIIGTENLTKQTEHSISDPEQLRSELAEIRRDGYAIDWDEQVVGMGMAAVPVRVRNEVLGSLGIIVPTGRIKNQSRRNELLTYLDEMEDTVSVNYQYGT